MKLYDKLLEFSKTDIYPMHMPGHKRNEKLLGMVNPYMIDITEIEGFDNLFNANGVIKEGMERAANLYNSRYANYIIGGSSCGILAAISACTNKGDKVLIARNSHKSIYNAIYLNELSPIYIYPQIDKAFGINCGIQSGDIKKALANHPDVKLIVITSPTYEGVISDIKSISNLAHEYKIPLLVDEAHGAHLGFHSYFPVNSIELGADIIVHSLHKTLPSFTQTGLLHVNSDLVDYRKVESYLSVYQSTSPSYILMASIDICINLLMKKGDKLFTDFVTRLEDFYKSMEKLNKLRILTRRENVDNFDPSKIVVSTRNTNITGKNLHDLLLKEYKIQVEMASTDYIIAMTSICDTSLGFSRLRDALLEVDEKVKKQDNIRENLDSKDDYLNILIHTPKIVMNSYQALNSKLEESSFTRSVGRISGEYVYLYPPGIPILVPGEEVTSSHIEQVKKYIKLGLSVLGLDDYTMTKIKVVK